MNGHAPAPQDAVAASICWLATEGRQHRALDPVLSKMETKRRHPVAGCRFCTKSQAEKLVVVTTGWAHAEDDPRWSAWKRLSNAQQFARVCEAQELSWIDQLPPED